MLENFQAEFLRVPERSTLLNQQTLVNELRLNLANLSAADREEILQGIETQFREAALQGTSEEEFARRIGNPRKIAAGLIAEQKLLRFKQAPHSFKKIRLCFGVMSAYSRLPFLKFMAALWPVIAALMVVFIAWIFSAALALTGVSLVGLFLFKALLISVGVWTHLSALFFALGMLSLGLLSVTMTAICTQLCLMAAESHFEWVLKRGGGNE